MKLLHCTFPLINLSSNNQVVEHNHHFLDPSFPGCEIYPHSQEKSLGHVVHTEQVPTVWTITLLLTFPNLVHLRIKRLCVCVCVCVCVLKVYLERYCRKNVLANFFGTLINEKSHL